MHSESVFLSILIPTWNRCDQLEARIQTILPLLGPDCELVISDNGSTDGTESMVRRTLRASPGARIRYLRNPDNLGADFNIRQVFQAGRGEWLWLVSDDDALDFTLPARLRPVLAASAYDVCLLQPAINHPHQRPSGVRCTEFLRREDRWGRDLLQIGHVLCRRELVGALGPDTWAAFSASLHSQLPPYARGIREKGILLVPCSLYAEPPASAPPRWDVLEAHLGAWRANLLAFPEHKELIHRRERRLRQTSIFDALVGRVLLGVAIAQAERGFAFRAFSLQGKVKLLVLFALSRLGPAGRRVWIPRFFPRNRALAQRIFAPPSSP
jgi:hypothetical protein